MAGEHGKAEHDPRLDRIGLLDLCCGVEEQRLGLLLRALLELDPSGEPQESRPHARVLGDRKRLREDRASVGVEATCPPGLGSLAESGNPKAWIRGEPRGPLEGSRSGGRAATFPSMLGRRSERIRSLVVGPDGGCGEMPGPSLCIGIVDECGSERTVYGTPV